jgi:AcrR family transcriptional regulator
VSTRPSPARDRLLQTASRIFYTRGIHSVGVEEVIATAGVTRSTMYRHFPGKEELVVAYLEAASAAERAQLEAALAAAAGPEEAVQALAGAVVAQLSDPSYRGCAFLNAAAEYPDVDHPVHQAVLAHRRWYAETVAATLEPVTGRRTPAAAELFVLLRDGAMAAGCLSDPAEVGRVFRRGVAELLADA